MNDSKSKLNRRQFLLAAGAGGATAAAALVTAPPVAQEAVAEPVLAPAAKRGYHVSEHIEKYYRTTQV